MPLRNGPLGAALDLLPVEEGGAGAVWSAQHQPPHHLQHTTVRLVWVLVLAAQV